MVCFFQLDARNLPCVHSTIPLLIGVLHLVHYLDLDVNENMEAGCSVDRFDTLVCLLCAKVHKCSAGYAELANLSWAIYGQM